MRVKVRQIHELGRPLRASLRAAAQQRSTELHRSVLTARVVGRADATEQPLLPGLLDATVLALRLFHLAVHVVKISH